MTLKYRQRIYLYLAGLFIIFSAITIYVVLNEEKMLKEQIIKVEQTSYAKVIDKYVYQNQLYPDSLQLISNIIHLFPEDFQLSVLNHNGDVLYHSHVEDASDINNQIMTTEIKRALIEGEGWSKRKSFITDEESVFYASYNAEKDYIIRIGIPYSDNVETLLSPNKTFYYSLILLFIIVFILFTMLYANHRNSILKLKGYILSFSNKKKSEQEIMIPEEMKELSTLIKNIYDEFEEKQKDSGVEKEKLLEHMHYTEEGISFFDKDYSNIYTNSYFIQYLNALLNEPTFDVQNIFSDKAFNDIVRFIKNPGDKTESSCKLHANGRYFFVRVIIFEDKSFEIIIRDISDMEKEYYDKAQLTNNIAHEIKTPITSIRGYLETILEHENLPLPKLRSFIERAYNQTIRLSEIIQDVILLSKTADARNLFELEDVNIYYLLEQQVKVDCLETIQKKNSKIVLNMQQDVVIKGNRTLLYSLFFNLGMNALKYAGENVTITINNYMEDDDYYYFSFSDNGVGIDEKFLPHIFERFYRIQEGRTREKDKGGGSGLGLSIVKDSVTFHNGTIIAKNRSEGGLEFLFTLRKD